jgi:hypothetical protein
MLNPFFQQGTREEQSLIQDLINEQLRMYGVEIYYLPRKYVTEKTIIKEVIESRFDDAYPIEAYVENFDGYADNTTILSKFGIQATNEITLIVSKERFEEYITPLIKDMSNIKLSSRPKEGDLVYFPLGDRLFEIKFVEHEKPFYQLQKNYVYELRCELFRYEDEVIDTDVDVIDDILGGSIGAGGANGADADEIFIGRTQTLTMIGIGNTATATATIVNGGIRLITITNRGGGYTSTPTVGISSAPSGGVTGIASAVMIGGVVACNDNVNPSAKSVQAVDIINAGSGYTAVPGIRFIGGGGSGAAATATIGNGIVGIVSITSSGSGYSTSPIIRFTNEIFATGVTTVSAAATAIVSSAGTITSIRITNAGLGYSVAPTITISSPYSSGIGTFLFNETITGQTSGTTGRVRKWNAVTNELEISNITGSFVVGETVVGTASSASYQIRKVDTNINEDGYSQNNEIELEADSILDFSEFNPFGTP